MAMNPQGLTQARPLVFTPFEFPNGIHGEVLTECSVVRPGLPAFLPSADQWRPWVSQLVADHSALPGYAPLKYSASGEVFRAQLDGGNQVPLNVVCRFHRSAGRGYFPFKQPGRARRNLRRAVRLLQVGIDTAIPLARIERPSPTPSSWLVTEHVAGLVDLDQIALTLLRHEDRRALRKVKAGLREGVVDLFSRLDGARLYHRDLKASNILFIHWNDGIGQTRTMLVDLDGLHLRRWWNERRRWQPLVRIAASLRNYPSLSRSDFARFLLLFLSRVGIPTSDWKLYFRRIDRESAAYARRSKQRKSHKLEGFSGD